MKNKFVHSFVSCRVPIGTCCILGFEFAKSLHFQINEVEEGFNASLISNTRSIKGLMHQSDVQANRTESVLESALSWFNSTSWVMTKKILANRYRVDSLQNEVSLYCKCLVYFPALISKSYIHRCCELLLDYPRNP